MTDERRRKRYEGGLLRVAQQYRDDGYSVTVRPAPDQLPAFAAGFAVDLLATRADRNALVRVFGDRGDLMLDPAFLGQVATTNAQPGWQHGYAILEEFDPVRHAVRTLGEPSAGQVGELLAEAERAAADAPRAAFLLARGGLAAALRRAVRRFAPKWVGETDPATLAGALYAESVLMPQEEYDRFRGVERLRLTVEHGLIDPAFGPDAIRSVIDLARGLLAAADAPAPPVATGDAA